jgi:hypothetical protein
MDNLNTHKGELAQEWLEGNPLVSFHYTPTHASYKGTSGLGISAAEALNYWRKIRDISRKHGCVEGVRFSSPARIYR